MEIVLPRPTIATDQFIRRLGYALHRDRFASEVSYTRRAGTEFFPRYHLYYDERGGELILKLHLDQKKPSYGGGTHAHAGDYDGTAVEREAARIKSMI